MIIKDLQINKEGDRARTSATLVWEESERAPFELFFETREPFVQDLTADPHAFLVASFVPAMEHGEKRLKIDQPISPTLRTGLKTAMGWLHHWYGPESTPLTLETRPGNPPRHAHAQKRAASFLSGGVDSLATLRKNRLDFPLDHPRSIKDCFFVHGFDIGGTEHGGREADAYDRAFPLLEAIAADAQVELIPVRTNVRLLDDDLHLWIYKFCGAATCSVAHPFSSRLTTTYIASSLDIPIMVPLGSHPLLDPNFGSDELDIIHDGIQLSRLDKVKLVGDWEVGLNHLRVCTMNPPGKPNCGRCEKCLRTMSELQALGKLAQSEAFPVKDLTPDLLENLTITKHGVNAMFCKLAPMLEAQGRQDLAEVIRRKSAEFYKRQRWQEERDWKGIIKKLDRKLLGGSLLKSYAALRRRSD